MVRRRFFPDVSEGLASLLCPTEARSRFRGSWTVEVGGRAAQERGVAQRGVRRRRDLPTSGALRGFSAAAESRASSHASLFGGQVRHGAKCPGDSAAAELVARTRSSHRRAPRRRATQSIPRCPRSTLRSPGASGSPPTRAKRNRSFEATTTLTAASEDPASRERTYSPPSQSLIDPRRPLAAGAVPSVVASTSAGAGSTNSCGTGPSWIWLGSPKSSWP